MWAYPQRKPGCGRAFHSYLFVEIHTKRISVAFPYAVIREERIWEWRMNLRISEFNNLKMENHVDWIFIGIFFYWIVIASFFCISKSEAILLSRTHLILFYWVIHEPSQKIATPAAACGFAMTDNNNNHIHHPNQHPLAHACRVCLSISRE